MEVLRGVIAGEEPAVDSGEREAFDSSHPSVPTTSAFGVSVDLAAETDLRRSCVSPESDHLARG